MGLKDDLEKRVIEILTQRWEERDGNVVPEPEDLKLSNDAVKLKASVLYADLTASTKLVDAYKSWFAAAIYKSYLHCAAKIISAEGGAITAYDGDRIMGVFIGDSKNTSAVRAALKINWAKGNILNAQLKNHYPKVDYFVQQTVGIDTSDLFIARTGVRGSNDLVWVGRAANYAAKLSSEPPTYSTYITSDIYENIHDSAKYADSKNMWVKVTSSTLSSVTVYGSTYWWAL